jgi:UDP-galactopyranose mutase
MFDNILDNPLIETHLDVDYFQEKDHLNCRHTYFSAPRSITTLLTLAKLEYCRKDNYVLPASVVNYPSEDYEFTHIVEYKHLLKQF